MAFLFSGLYEAIPDVDLYLERIDYHGDQRPTLDNLRELVRKNQTHIPYGSRQLFRLTIILTKCIRMAITSCLRDTTEESRCPW